MAITVTATPNTLSSGDFTPVTPPLVDPADGHQIDAYTSFNYNFPAPTWAQSSGVFTVFDPKVITITPNCRRDNTKTITPGLLSHEQFHYDVGIVTGRALARHLMRLKGTSAADIQAKVQAAVDLHFITRTGLLQRRYDTDTRHGTNAHYQAIWKKRMTDCLANANATQLGGFLL